MVTGAIYKGFVFDGIDSKQYGVYITGQGVFDAPVRDVEMIEIPGRNGSYALDKGRFKNIEVTYPAGMFGNTDSEFRIGISRLRNALASRKGYCRLTDDYGNNEYRMAVYKSGLEVSLAQLKAGQFDITFDCKPQRFRTDGENPRRISSGGTLSNPTAFESHPLILVDGYGSFTINDNEPITIQQGAVIGETALEMSRSTGGNASRGEINLTANNLTSDLALSGDTITLGVQSFTFRAKTTNGQGISNFQYYGTGSGNYSRLSSARASNEYYVLFNVNTLQNQFTFGTSATHTETLSVNYDITYRNAQTTSSTATFTFTIAYNGTNGFTITCAFSPSSGTALAVDPTNTNPATGSGASYVDSTKSALGQLYIDLDIGECYRIENGEYISINNATTLPAELPVLNDDLNTITYDNTFTSFKIAPRWWQL